MKKEGSTGRNVKYFNGNYQKKNKNWRGRKQSGRRKELESIRCGRKEWKTWKKQLTLPSLDYFYFNSFSIYSIACMFVSYLYRLCRKSLLYLFIFLPCSHFTTQMMMMISNNNHPIVPIVPISSLLSKSLSQRRKKNPKKKLRKKSSICLQILKAHISVLLTKSKNYLWKLKMGL